MLVFLEKTPHGHEETRRETRRVREARCKTRHFRETWRKTRFGKEIADR
jgi:hypothetical protein